MHGGTGNLPEQEGEPKDPASEQAEAPNSIVVGEELQDDDASDEQLISGGMPD